MLARSVLLLLVLAGALLATGESILEKSAHRDTYSLDQMTDKADGIFLVKKIPPFVTEKRTFFDNAKKYPPLVSHMYRFQVLETLKQVPGIHDSSINVTDPYLNLASMVHSLYHVRKLVIEPRVGWYTQPLRMDSLTKMIVFVVNSDSATAKTKEPRTYSFAIFNAFESPSKEDTVRAILKRFSRPLKHTTNFMLDRMRAIDSGGK